MLEIDKAENLVSSLGELEVAVIGIFGFSSVGPVGFPASGFSIVLLILRLSLLLLLSFLATSTME